jgi:hypothetical protein
MLTLNPNPARLLAAKLTFVFHQPFSGSGQRRLASDHYAYSLNLSSGLFAVASIGKEHAFGFTDDKDAGCSRKPAKVSHIGEMGD